MVADAHQYIDNLPDDPKPTKITPRKADGRAKNKGCGYRRPIVVIRGEQCFEFPSINACANSQMFKCSPKTIRRFAEKRAVAGDCMVYYKDQLPEGLR